MREPSILRLGNEYGKSVARELFAEVLLDELDASESRGSDQARRQLRGWTMGEYFALEMRQDYHWYLADGRLLVLAGEYLVASRLFDQVKTSVLCEYQALARRVV